MEGAGLFALGLLGDSILGLHHELDQLIWYSIA